MGYYTEVGDAKGGEDWTLCYDEPGNTVGLQNIHVDLAGCEADNITVLQLSPLSGSVGKILGMRGTSITSSVMASPRFGMTIISICVARR